MGAQEKPGTATRVSFYEAHFDLFVNDLVACHDSVSALSLPSAFRSLERQVLCLLCWAFFFLCTTLFFFCQRDSFDISVLHLILRLRFLCPFAHTPH